MLNIILFYVFAYLTGFWLCIMPGPIAIEIFHHAIKKEKAHALSVGLGAAMGDAIWAMVAFYGITPFLKNGNNGNVMESIFLLVAAVVTFALGVVALRDKAMVKKVGEKEERIATKVKRKRWFVVKGLMMVMVNPLGIGSWVIVLAMLKKAKIYIPLNLGLEVGFYTCVMLGAFSYSLLMVSLTNRFEALFKPERTAKIIRVLGFMLIGFSIYFLFFSTKAFFAF
jgi:threonine/homoserine/homoserine lactone efflux protein